MKVFLSVVLVSVVAAQQQQERQAVAVISGPNGVSGNVTFTQSKNTVLINGVIKGLAKGPHGFHVHEKGDLRNGCASTGSHFNPDKKNHGSPGDNDRHIGDLGNIVADEQGIAKIDLKDEQISLTGSKRNIIGRAVVIHADSDDFGKGGHNDSLSTGHAGARVGCGVIGLLTPYRSGSAPINSFMMPLSAASLILAFLNLL